MVVDDMRVGIGTENPGGTLHVAGLTVTELLVITGGADLAEPCQPHCQPKRIWPRRVLSQ
jgi:hypothetical protein